MTSDAEISESCEQKADVVAGVHVSRAADAPALGPLLCDERAAHGPFAADADAGEQAEDGELPDVDDESAEQSERGVPEDCEHQSADAAKFISDRAPDERQAPANQEKSEERAAVEADVCFGRRDARTRQQIAQRRDEHERVDEGVHAVERPTAPGSPEAADLVARERWCAIAL